MAVEPGVLCGDNGVDCDFWTTERNKADEHGGKLRVGWVGKVDRNQMTVKELGWRKIVKPLALQLEDSCRIVENCCLPGDCLSMEGMREWYRNIDVLLVTTVQEGTPMPALEAMACGIPVISTAVGDMPQCIIHGETGALCGTYSDNRTAALVVEQMAGWLRKLAAERGLCVHMGDHAARKMRLSRDWRVLATPWLRVTAQEARR